MATRTQHSPIQYPSEEDLIFPKYIRNRSDLSWGEKSFLAEVISIDIMTKGKCYYSLKDLSKRFFVSNITIHTWVKKLVKMGLIDISSLIEDKEKIARVIRPILFRIAAE